jgi:hypothetical protein
MAAVSSVMTILDVTQLSSITGGSQQEQLRDLAKSYCPQTYAANQSRPITRPLAERCLDEAGYGSYKGMLDKYFPRR